MKTTNIKTGLLVAACAAAALLVLPVSGKAAGGDKAPGGKEAAAEAPAAGDAKQQQFEIRSGNPVVATVNGKDVNRSDVLTFIGTLPEQTRQMPIQNLFPLALEQVVNNMLVDSKVSGAKLDGDPEVQKMLEQAKQQIVRNVYIDRELDKEVTKKKLLKAYDELLTKLEDVQETKARHILVDSEGKAKEIIKKLKDGAKFEDLVKEYSKGPSAENGGELGWFAKSEMIPEFADAAFALGKDETSKEPLKTQFGWHVIKVDDRRKRPEPDFEEVKPQLELQLRQQALTETLKKWQQDSKVKKFDINGDPVKETKAN